MDDSKLIVESNLTARQPRRVPTTLGLYIQFNHCLAKEGLVSLTEVTAPLIRCYPLLYGPPGVHMEQKSQSRFLTWLGFEHQTSR